MFTFAAHLTQAFNALRDGSRCSPIGEPAAMHCQGGHGTCTLKGDLDV